MEKYKDALISISDAIFDFKEVEFDVPKSSKLIQDFLEENGFEIERNVAGLAHAFVASYGSGSPVVGILGEFDALDGIGHACGHNLLGTGALGAVLLVKDRLKTQGTIKYFGCPAEESGYGKAIMVKAGVFDGVSAALTWHPHHKTAVWTRPSLAVQQTFFKFNGVSAHAALSPDLGRSALDAAELMNIGCNYLREHVRDSVRIHYSYLDVGGKSPNVVQSDAMLNYFVRAAQRDELESVQKRVEDVARGAALMSGVSLEIIEGSSCENFVANKVLSDRLKSIVACDVENDFDTIEAISTDVGDVSQCVPTAQVFIECEPYPFPMHSIEWVENGKSDQAHSGIFKAAQVLSTLALELFENEALLEEIL